MANIALNLPKTAVEQAMRVTGKRTPRAALLALVEQSGNVPNAETARAIRSKTRGKTIHSREEFSKLLDSL